LEKWLLWKSAGKLDPKVVAQHQAEAHADLDQLAEFLDNLPPKVNMGSVRLGGWWGAVGLAPADLARAQDLYRRVYVTGGTGNSFVQESLLQLIAATEDPASVPFWVEILDLNRPRDTFAETRRTLALAALARLAIRHSTPAAYDALRGAARHVHPKVRALAVYYLGRAYLEAEHPIPPEPLADLSDIATHDAAFEPRFQARSILRTAGLPVPLDNPGGVYAFKVKFKWAKRIHRTIELKSEQTLDDLHFAIQQAISWDADHLYSFYMNGRLHDERYAFACPQDEDSPPFTDEAVIGELGLVVKHTFLYYFDYGDSHEFEVEVVGIRPKAERGKYPRVVDSQGKAPPQYGWGDEEE
jgi:hypothetical protein